jgi:dATP pyrophosphohydrolase
MKKLIDLYPYKIIDNRPAFLLLKRSSDKIYANQWRMIGGKVKENETYWKAALRELNEETGHKPLKFWSVPSINQFYEPSTDQIHHIPAFAAELNKELEIILDEEHSTSEWIYHDEAESYLHWPEQIRIIVLIHHLITSNKILPDWIISTD